MHGHQTWDKILKIFEKSKFWSYWYWFWYWKLQFQNIDFDIDIEICISKILILILILKFLGILILILVLILKKNGGNIENMSSENEASSYQALSFVLDFLFFSLKFWDCFLSFRFFIIILGMIRKKLVYSNQS